MFPNNCQAILTTADDALLEYGTASISVKNKSVDFINSFVPLIKIGAPVKIICTENGQYTHIFSGEVYLSSQTLLRIISVKCTLLPHAEKVLSVDVSISATVSVPATKNKVFSMSPIQKWNSCNICNISTQKLSFKSQQLEFDWHSPVTIKIKAPIFDKNTEISLKANEDSLVFGDNARYDCKIISISDTAVVELINYIRKINLEILSDILDVSSIIEEHESI